jgi:hypothetical protein
MNWKDKAYQDLLEIVELELHKVRIYKDRIAIWRKDNERLTWEEIQEVKCKVWGDRTAIEIYPSECDVVNLRHTRHLWWSPELENMVKKVCQHKEFEKC